MNLRLHTCCRPNFDVLHLNNNVFIFYVKRNPCYLITCLDNILFKSLQIKKYDRMCTKIPTPIDLFYILKTLYINDPNLLAYEL